MTRPLAPSPGLEEGGPLRIVVQIDPNRTNPNRLNSSHWTDKMRRMNSAKDAGRLAWKAAGCPKLEGQVRVEAIIRRNRGFDEDNAWGALKPLKDALFCGKRYESDGGAITPDDSPRWVRLGEVSFEIHKRWKGCEEVEFVIREVVADA